MSSNGGDDAADGLGADLARKALQRLLVRAENAAARSPSAAGRTTALRFSEDSFPDYLHLARHLDKAECNACLQLAEREGAIRIEWDSRAGDRTHVARIVLTDGAQLARHLGVAPRWALVTQSEQSFAPYADDYPVLAQVIDAWRKGNSPRGTRPGEVTPWLEGIRVIQQCAANEGDDIPVRRLSATLFGDSKRVEALWPVLDALRQGDALAPPGEMEEVFSGLGLVKFPPTLLVAGDVEFTYGDKQVAASRPYVGFAPSEISAARVGPAAAEFVLTVENLTTFHELASHRRANAIVLYCGGMPSPSWKRIYAQLLSALPADARVYHWGDIDGGGFRIASHIAHCCAEAGRSLLLHGMRSDISLPGVVARRELAARERSEILRICERWYWTDEASALGSVAIEQEAMDPTWPE